MNQLSKAVLCKRDPFLDEDGVLRVCERLRRGEFPLCSKTPNHLVFQPPSIQVVGEISAQNSQTCWNRTSLVLNETGMLDRRRKGHGETNYMEVCQMSEDKKPNYQQSRWQISLKTELPCLLPLSTTQELTTLDKSL